MAVNDLHNESFTAVDPYTGVTSTVTGDAILAERTWYYDQLWWYCFVAILLMIAFFEVVKLMACRYICFLKR